MTNAGANDGVLLVKYIFLSLVLTCLTLTNSAAHADETVKTIVLVHGAFADGSSFNKVIPILQNKGLKAVAVQNPMTSLADDVAFTQRAIANAKGKVVLVGHSWGGVVITEAGNDPKVESLVYISAFAPNEGQHLRDILHDAHEVKKIPSVPGFVNPVVDDAGFIRLSEETILTYFAEDIPDAEGRLIAATQGHLHKDTLTQRVKKAAWRSKPSYFIVSSKDQMIAPGLLRSMASNINATTVELATSHVPMLSQPMPVARLILHAAGIRQL